MAARENDDGLRPLIRQNVRGHWVSVETGATESGVPDLNGFLPRAMHAPSKTVMPGAEVWIETKATRGHAVKLRPMQIGWLMTRVRHGGRAFVAVRRHVTLARDGIVDELHLVDGAYAGILSTSGLQSTPAIAMWPGGSTRWDWRALDRYLHVYEHDVSAAYELPAPRRGL